MEPTIIRSLLQCSLSDSERKPIRLEAEDLAEDIVECELIVYVMVLSLKEAFKKRDIDGGLWCFDVQLLVIKDWVRGEDPLNYQFDECTFWLHVRGLKAEFFSWDVASKLANSFPGCEEYPLLEERSDPKKECVYDLWIKASMEKSWIVFKLNDEPTDTLPRRLGEESSRQGEDWGWREGGIILGAQTVSLGTLLKAELLEALEYWGNLAQIIIPRGSEDKEGSETPSPLAPRLTYSGGAKGEEGGKGKQKMGLVSSPKKRFHPYPKSGGSRGQAKKLPLSGYGLGAFPEDETAKHLVKVNKPNLILVEIKLWKQEWDVIKLKLKMPNAFLVDSRGRKGGLAMLWPRSLNVTVMSYSSHHIEALIEDEDVIPWSFVGFYGHHEVKHKRISLELLRFINNNSSLPTAFLGDFNEVLDVTEHSSYRRQRPMWQNNMFKKVVVECDLMDIGFVGFSFT
ncbi:hypothetical protein LIER_10900 [Lithospermum erythrorhizon]|uniref:DUF4283 domain-containing protein n=1 Tax=Lithospermum erythrorhizon TaxID=34254 RepID=A0AAV3PN45_LITER